MTTWNTAPPKPTSDQALFDREDQLLKQLAEAQFEKPVPTSEPSSAAAPQIVAALPVHEVDPDQQAIHAALQAGMIPTFADEPGTTPQSALQPIDVNAEREAYVVFLAFIEAHKDPATTVTFIDPATYAKGLL